MQTSELSYYYIPADSNFNMTLDWMEQANVYREYILEKIIDAIDQKDPLVPDSEKPKKELYTTQSPLMIPFYIYDYNKSSGKLTTFDSDGIDELVDKIGIHAPIALEHIKKALPKLTKFWLNYLDESCNFSLFPHCHCVLTNKDGSYDHDPRTVTVVIPTRHTVPVTETMKFTLSNYSLADKEKLHIDHIDVNYYGYRHDIEGEVIEVRLPSPGEYLVLDFNSHHYYHWIDNSNPNEYLLLISEY